MVFVAVSLPKLARNEGSYYKASLEGFYVLHLCIHSVSITIKFLFEDDFYENHKIII